MNIFKTFTLTWWQAGLFKIALVSLGIVLGATWSKIFAPWRAALLAVYAVAGAAVTCVWWKQ